MDILGLTLKQIDIALRAGILSKNDILAASDRYGASEAVLDMLDAWMV